MTKKKLRTKSIKQKMVDELDTAPEIIVDPEQIIQASGKEQVRRTLPEAAVPYKFKPGQSGNPSGRPRDILKSIGLNIAAKKAKKILSVEELELIRQLDMNPEDVTVAESIMLMLGTSTNKDKLELFLDRTFGKVPNENINTEVSVQLFTKFKSKLTDAELQRIAVGEDVLDILLEKLPDVDGASVIESQFEDDDVV